MVLGCSKHEEVVCCVVLWRRVWLMVCVCVCWVCYVCCRPLLNHDQSGHIQYQGFLDIFSQESAPTATAALSRPQH